jgi:hypothetical protein
MGAEQTVGAEQLNTRLCGVSPAPSMDHSPTQAALTALKSSGVVFLPEVLRHTSPIRYTNINFRGTFKFPVEKYMVELLGDNVPGIATGVVPLTG